MAKIDPVPFYLYPYQEAREHGARGIPALLWSSKEGQQVRFEALARICPMAGKTVLDVGCGRADFLGYLLEQGIEPARYVGMDMIPAALRSARRKKYPRCELVQADFVSEPESLHVGAEVITFSGSLNTLTRPRFYRALRAAWDATEDWLAFNFLSSQTWCGASWLTWHRRKTVLAFLKSLGGEPVFDESYLEGDCTVAVRRP